MAKYLIVNADDLGISPSVSEGIITSHERGIVTSTTVMTNVPSAKDGFLKAQERAPKLGLGLHITLSYGAPVLPAKEVPSLVDTKGNFLSFPLLAEFSSKELQAEIYAQFDQFTQLSGKIPDHLDSHQFMANVHPAAFETMLELAEKHKIPIRNPSMFLSIEKLHQFMKSRGTLSQPALDQKIPLLQNICSRYSQIQWPHFFEHRFYAKEAKVKNLLSILKELPKGITELMCHPGYIVDLKNDYYREERELEIAVLTDHEIRAAILEYNIQLITFAQIEKALSCDKQSSLQA